MSFYMSNKNLSKISEIVEAMTKKYIYNKKESYIF